jgi:tetratricopeptide (TPR) repeat protein
MKATGRMQGTVLIEMGCISPHNLNHALQVQLQEKLYDAFRWDEGEYQLNPKVALPPEPLSLGMTAAQLIVEGVRRTYDDKRLAKALKGLDEKYAHPASDPLLALQDAGLAADEQELMALVDGHKKVSTLRALEVLPRLDTDRLLYAMKCAQMLELKDEAAAGKAQPNIARLAEAAAKSREVQAVAVPPPLPPAPQVKPPPLPKRTPGVPMRGAAASSLPWDDAPKPPMAQVSSGNWGSPPPPPLASPQRKKAPNVAQPVGSLLPELSEVMSLPKLSSDEGVQREKLAAKVAGMRKLDYFEILGVKRNADRETIKRAYFGLAKEFHPDRHFGSASAEVRQLAQQIYDLVSTAHDTLTDPAERARYVKDLDAGLKKNMNEDVGKILAAEGKFQRGEEHMRQRQFGEAHRAFSEAIALYADEGEFHAWLGWSHFQLHPEDTESAVASIERAVSLNPKLDKSYLFLGYIFKATGRPDKAERQFEKAIQCNPDCTEALRELRLLGHARR